MRPPTLTQSIGTVSIFRYGAGPNGIMRTLGQFMGASGATFGYVDAAPPLPTSRCTRPSLMPCSVVASSCLLEVSFAPTPLLLSKKRTGTRAGVPLSWQPPTEHPSLDATSKRDNALAKLRGHTLHGRSKPAFGCCIKRQCISQKVGGRGVWYGIMEERFFGRHNTISSFRLAAYMIATYAW